MPAYVCRAETREQQLREIDSSTPRSCLSHNFKKPNTIDQSTSFICLLCISPCHKKTANHKPYGGRFLLGRAITLTSYQPHPPPIKRVSSLQGVKVPLANSQRLIRANYPLITECVLRLQGPQGHNCMMLSPFIDLQHANSHWNACYEMLLMGNFRSSDN